MRNFVRYTFLRFSVLLVLIFVLLANSGQVKAQVSGFSEAETTLASPQKGLTAYIGVDEKLNEYWKLSSFLLVTNGWGEAYTGPTYSLDNKFSLNLSLGFEQSPTGLIPRYATSLFVMVSDRISALGTLEVDNAAFRHNYAGVWYDLNLMYQIKDSLAVGIKDRRPIGIGPVAQISWHGNDFWVEWAVMGAEEVEFYPTNFLVGVKHNF